MSVSLDAADGVDAAGIQEARISAIGDGSIACLVQRAVIVCDTARFGRLNA